MNKALTQTFLITILLFVGAGSTLSAQKRHQCINYQTSGDTSISGTLSQEEISGIQFLREEEKLARDVYLYLYEIYPLRPFLNISGSEQMHMDAVKYLIDTYGLEDPVANDEHGVFKNTDLQALYNKLIEEGSKSAVDALKTGALIEEKDIADLQHELDSSVKNPDVVRVYTNLKAASGNHLRAYVRNLTARGVNYEPVILDKETFSAIIGN